MLEALRVEVLAANLAVAQEGLARLTFGNVSGREPGSSLVVIKPSGVPYPSLHAEDLVVVDLSGKVVAGRLRPSSDTPTHLVLYRAFPELGGVVHTHSTYAAAFAQARRPIPLLGTTHADLSPAAVPVTRALEQEDVAGGYEEATGEAIVEAVGESSTAVTPAVLAAGHGPFVFGTSPAEALERSVMLEEIAKLALFTLLLEPAAATLETFVRDKHFARKHGPGAYYGQQVTAERDG